MNPSDSPLTDVAAASKRIAQRALCISGNRMELLLVEVQEERERLIRTLILILAMGAFGILAGVTFSAAVILMFRDRSPLTAAVALTVVYGGAAGWLYYQLQRLRQDWAAFSATLDQMRKDRECFTHALR